MGFHFLPRVVNGPFHDPGIFVPFMFDRRALLFDLGDIRSLSSRDILKISHVFITHTHLDHFIGFDRLLRLFLGREKQLYLYGPKGFLKNLAGKLSAYTWNLVKNFRNQFVIQGTEVNSGMRITNQFACRQAFFPVREPVESPFEGSLLDEPALTVSAAVLDHGTPCLGYCLKERFHINIIKEGLARLGLEPGPWLSEFKQALYAQADPESVVRVGDKRMSPAGRPFSLGALAEGIARITPGRHMAYITDVAYTPSNIKKIVNLAQDADHLYIEAAFLEKDRDMAKRKYHLTARQAGLIAAAARVKKFTLFHFSPRYTDRADLLRQEAQQAYTTHVPGGDIYRGGASVSNPDPAQH